MDVKGSKKNVGKPVKKDKRKGKSTLIKLLGYKKTLESVFENLMNQHNLSLGKLIQPIRFVLSGLTYGPGIFDTMVLLGQEACIKRLAAGLKELN